VKKVSANQKLQTENRKRIMRCPYCHSTNNKVIDSRPSREANAIRRRRECLNCNRRFTTYEQVEETMPLIIKKDGRREPYQRTKISEGIKKACEKRPVSIDVIEDFLDDLEREMLESGQREIPSTWIGETVMHKLREWDDVAYVRFASVYRHFTDATDFMKEIRDLLESRKTANAED
jgi:transcriptional repressor NrdR